ncbi:MAG: HAD family hydrolase [Spirulinaceae cyanobacterium]
MLRIITDFDGPIMDVSERYYQVYQLCLEKAKDSQQPIKVLSKQEFWRLKRSRVPEREIGKISGLYSEQAKIFARLRRETVHSLPYLVYDQPVPGAIATLEKIQKTQADLLVMTMRRDGELEDAFNRYNLRRFFPAERCYCLPQDYVKETDIKDKTKLMAKALAELPEASASWMIGDTEADMIAAKTHQIKSIAVLSGIRDRPQLEKYQPNFIVNNLSEAVELVWQESLQTVS